MIGDETKFCRNCRVLLKYCDFCPQCGLKLEYIESVNGVDID